MYCYDGMPSKAGSLAFTALTGSRFPCWLQSDRMLHNFVASSHRQADLVSYAQRAIEEPLSGLLSASSSVNVTHLLQYTCLSFILFYFSPSTFSFLSPLCSFLSILPPPLLWCVVWGLACTMLDGGTLVFSFLFFSRLFFPFLSKRAGKEGYGNCEGDLQQKTIYSGDIGCFDVTLVRVYFVGSELFSHLKWIARLLA